MACGSSRGISTSAIVDKCDDLIEDDFGDYVASFRGRKDSWAGEELLKIARVTESGGEGGG